MADVTTTPVDQKPASVPQTVIDVRVLMNSSGNGVPAFNQGSYSDRLPVQNSDNNRTIQRSGCGLCAVASVMAAAGCRVPVLDPSTRTFSVSAGAATINPSTLLKYFSDYATSQTTSPSEALTWAKKNIFEGPDSGVLQNGSATVKAALNNLVALSNPGTTPAFDNTQGSPGGATGSDVPAITSALEAGNPVILAVCFTGNPCTSYGNHQVLAVGIAKIGTSTTLYVINDSGYNVMDPRPPLKAGGTVTMATLNACTASSKRALGYTAIFRYRVMAGLQPITNLLLQPLFTK